MSNTISKEKFMVNLFGDNLNIVSLTPTLLETDTTIIFLHDAIGSVEQWRSFPEAIVSITGAKGYVYDRLGHGSSDTMPFIRDKNFLHIEAFIYLRALIEKLRLKRIFLVGHSDGATISLLYASKFNDVVGLVAMAPHIFVEEITLQGIREFKKIYESQSLGAKLAKFHGPKTEILFNAWQDIWQAPFFRDWNIEKNLPLIQCPTLLIQGIDDEYGTQNQVDAIAKAVPNIFDKVLLPNCAHFPHVSARKAVEEKIKDFYVQVNQNSVQHSL